MAMCVGCGGFVEEDVDECEECEEMVQCDRCDDSFEFGELEDGVCSTCLEADDYHKQVADDYRFMTRP